MKDVSASAHCTVQAPNTHTHNDKRPAQNIQEEDDKVTTTRQPDPRASRDTQYINRGTEDATVGDHATNMKQSYELHVSLQTYLKEQFGSELPQCLKRLVLVSENLKRTLKKNSRFKTQQTRLVSRKKDVFTGDISVSKEQLYHILSNVTLGRRLALNEVDFLQNTCSAQELPKKRLNSTLEVLLLQLGIAETFLKKASTRTNRKTCESSLRSQIVDHAMCVIRLLKEGDPSFEEEGFTAGADRESFTSCVNKMPEKIEPMKSPLSKLGCQTDEEADTSKDESSTIGITPETSPKNTPDSQDAPKEDEVKFPHRPTGVFGLFPPPPAIHNPNYWLKHAANCVDPVCHPDCQQVKSFFVHAKTCKTCDECKWLRRVCAYHIGDCTEKNCPLPFCKAYESLAKDIAMKRLSALEGSLIIGSQNGKEPISAPKRCSQEPTPASNWKGAGRDENGNKGNVQQPVTNGNAKRKKKKPEVVLVEETSTEMRGKYDRGKGCGKRKYPKNNQSMCTNSPASKRARLPKPRSSSALKTEPYFRPISYAEREVHISNVVDQPRRCMLARLKFESKVRESID